MRTTATDAEVCGNIGMFWIHQNSLYFKNTGFHDSEINSGSIIIFEDAGHFTHLHTKVNRWALSFF